MRRTAAGLVCLALAVLATGCGSTVQVKSTLQSGGSGLGGTEAPAGTAAGQSAGSGGLSTTAPGSGGLTTTGGSATGGGGPSSGGTAAPQAGSTGGSALQPGAGSLTGPIELGFMTTTVGNAQSLGVNAGQTYSDQQMFDALVKETNAHGGLAGRKILPVYGDTDTASSDWNTQFNAACSKLTQDHKVKAVLGYVFVFLDSFEQCLAKAGVAHLYGGYQPGDVQAQRDFPNVTSTTHPTVDVANLTVLKGALQTGRLSTKSKLGILVDDCAHGLRAFANSTEPYLKAQHLTYEVVKMDCAAGSGDAGPAATSVKNAQLQFSAHGVDTVFAGGVALLLFMANAESQSYHPQYLTSVGGAALEPNAPSGQLANMHGFGWLPAVDTNQTHQPNAPRPAQQACLKMLRNQGLNPTAYNDFMAAYIACDALNLYARALVRTGGRTDPAQIQQAVLAEMPGFAGAATYDGVLRNGAGQRGGPGRWREYGWTGSCSCFTYRGPTYPIPTP